MMHLEPDTIHSSEEAFQLRGVLTPLQGIAEIWQGTRSFFFWPENYFPDYLKALQLALLGRGRDLLPLAAPAAGRQDRGGRAARAGELHAARAAAAGAEGPFPQPHAHRLRGPDRRRRDDRLPGRAHAHAKRVDRRCRRSCLRAM